MYSSKGKERLIDPEKLIQDSFSRIKVIQNVNQKLKQNIDYNKLPAAKKELQKAKQMIIDNTQIIKQNIEQLKDLDIKDFNKQKKTLEEKFTQAFETFEKLAKDIAQRQYHYRRSTIQIQCSEGSDDQDPKQSQINQDQFQVYDQAKFEEQLLEERQSELNGIEKLVKQVNSLMNEAADQVDSQQKMINVIEENVVDTQKNAEKAESELNQANIHSKKSYKKYICFVSVILIIVAILLGIFFLANK